MVVLYARLPDTLHERLSEEARMRGLSITTTTQLLLEAALDRADRERSTAANRGRRYPDA